ncbi:gamma-glutamylcyclotransferase family protein [Flavobacterium ovatum]|uniref:gamma-glutamylcyclotransferase family protein n=1 Tax=Flavobacterium ovatum TaxID=1928857 RepID=UPI00344C7963
MANLFAYGTLKDADVHQNIFGRLLKGTPDSLIGYTITQIEIEEEFGMETYPIITATENPKDIISGWLYEVTDEEIQLADTYEGLHYKRAEVTVESNVKAWAYIVTD